MEREERRGRKENRIHYSIDIIPFWINHSLDAEHGGYFTCLDTKGNVFDTDKFVWLQGKHSLRGE
jgi:mannose/cellobiose epimerase-like protein (N-acyl-D-glucosamine 2-epimerase family)